MKSKNESNLIIGVKKGDQNAFKKMFDLYSQPLYKFSYSYLKSKEVAEDVVQEVFVKIWNNRTKLKTDTSFQSYLFTIAINLVRKHFNKQSRLNEIKHDFLIDFSKGKDDIDDNADYQEQVDKLYELIDQMPEKRKLVFVKKKFEEKSLKEIAQELDITPKTVEYHITEAMKFLKRGWKVDGLGMLLFHYFFNL